MIIIFIRAFVLYLLVVVVMRMMGKRQIAEMQPFELVITIMIADLAATPMENTSVPLINGFIPILTLLSVQVIVSYISLKSDKFRELICGKPSILVHKGRLVQSELRRLRINMSDLLEQLRAKDYPNLSDVEYVILETNGQLSVVPKPDKRNVITSDLAIATQQEELPVTLVVDGQVNKDNLTRIGYDMNWLVKQVEAQDIRGINNVFFAFVSSDGTFYVQEKVREKSKV